MKKISPEFVPVHIVAKRIGVDPRTLIAAALREELPIHAIYIGTKVMFRADDVTRWLGEAQP